jgi:hypothetical protein
MEGLTEADGARAQALGVCATAMKTNRGAIGICLKKYSAQKFDASAQTFGWDAKLT